jgi:hypothetical protein
MNSNETKLDSMKPDILTLDTESAEPDIELTEKINAGQRVGTPNVINPQEQKPDITPPTLSSKSSK